MQDEGITVLKGRKDALGGQQGGKAIPDFLRVEPDEQELKYKEVRAPAGVCLSPAAGKGIRSACAGAHAS